MKKMALILIGIILTFGLSSCGGNDIGNSRQDSAESTVSPVLKKDTEQSDTEVVAEPDDTRKTESGKILIAYFSVPEDVDINGVDAIAGGSGASRTVDTISQLQPGAVLMGNELVLSRNSVADSEETVAAWAEGLGLNAKTELPVEGNSNTVLSATADDWLLSLCPKG